ncbi:hypothetical protein AAG906_018303 [Vitis piasezkii]
MESTSSLLLPSAPCFSSCAVLPEKHVRKVVAASNGTSGRDYGGKLVDENMIVLRMRIREMKMLRRKRYYERYNGDVCEAVGLLQSYLMNIRPSLALGFLALITLSVPISTAVVILHAIEMARGILSGFI